MSDDPVSVRPNGELPYPSGSNSALFRGFFGVSLVTFGSSGLIGNLLAGILLTYARAFKVGDVVRIEGVYGTVTEKTLLVTRVVTVGNEHVSIPNSKVIGDSVTNYSTHGLNKGVAVSVVATIGYDADWRTVHKLLLDGAARTGQTATDPAPRVLEQSFGNYSVEYELRAWTKTSKGNFRDVCCPSTQCVGTFADGGVEIMTPTILSHRDASELAVSTERFPNSPRPCACSQTRPSAPVGVVAGKTPPWLVSLSPANSSPDAATCATAGLILSRATPQ